MSSMKSAHLLLGSSDADIRYRSGLVASDPFLYINADGEDPVVFFDAREYETQKRKLKALKNGVRIERLETYGHHPLPTAAVDILNHRGIKVVRISNTMPYGTAQMLQRAGFHLIVHDYARERECKTDREISYMRAAQRANESAFELARKVLSESTIHKSAILYKHAVLTSERMKILIRKHLLDLGYECPEGMVVASGEQTARPHDGGSGEIRPHQPIIIDLFPRSEETGYFADMTRTFVKGKPSDQIQELYHAVFSVQREVANRISLGDSCSDIHAMTVDLFRNLGHKTSPEEGFMHGTGHSLGLEIHENPRITSSSDRTVEAGMVCTVEPGLYYPNIGGVRIEDIVVFYPDGHKENITRYDHPYVIP